MAQEGGDGVGSPRICCRMVPMGPSSKWVQKGHAPTPLAPLYMVNKHCKHQGQDQALVPPQPLGSLFLPPIQAKAGEIHL